MKRFLPLFFLLFSVSAAFSQCLNINASATSVSCSNGNDGEITINVTSGVGPFTYELYLFRPGVGQTPMGSVNSASTTVVFKQGNGTLSALFEATGIKANSAITPPGNEYRVLVSASGTSGDPFCEIVGVTGITVTQPPVLSVALNDIDPDCDPAVGVGNGKIDISVSGGVGPYTITWSGPTAIPNGTLVTTASLDAGTYTVTVEDSKGCVHSLNIDMPVATQADAGPPTAVTCGTNSIDLSANAPGPGEYGTWTGPPGVTFSPNINDRNATANNLSPGSNILRWTIVDSGGLCPGTYDEIDVTFSDAINLSATVTDVLCNGASTGAINLNVAGGVSPFTFAWSNGAVVQNLTNIPAGTYTVTVTDAALCTKILSNIVVSEPSDVVSGTTTQVDVTCFGASTGSITITGAGGVAPYDFSIDGGATYTANDVPNHTFPNLSAGTHSLTVRDANGCVSPAIPVTLAEPASAVSGTTTDVDVTCFGASTGSITITGSGGVGPYDFSIDNGATYSVLDAANHTFPGLAAGVYNLKVRDANGCETPGIAVTITEPAATVGGTTSQVDVLCFGSSTGEIAITGTGGTGPYDFSIDGGATYTALDVLNHTFTNLAAAAYSLKVRDANGCESPAIPVTITEPAAVVSGTTTQVDVLCFGDNTGSISITGAGGVGPYDFSIDGGTTYSVVDVANHTFPNLTVATYNLKVREANGCESPVIPVTLGQPASAVSGTTTQVDVACFGGSTGSVTVTGAGGVGPYDFSIDGGATYPVIDAANHTFPNLAAGAYSLTVRDANGCETTPIAVTLNEPASAVNATTTQVDVTCFGAATGSVTITGAGGVGPYDFSIDNGATYSVLAAASNTFSGLAAGLYTLKVRDANGCESPGVPVTITEPAATVGGTTTQVDVLCFGTSTGEITITGTGGTGPYDFSIDGGATYPALDAADHTFSNLAAAAYSLKVRDANGCESPLIPVNITQPGAAVTATTSQVDVLCFGDNTGSISMTGLGGVGPYDFSIDGGATYAIVDVADHTFPNLTAGAYSLKVRDANGCESAAIALTIAAPAAVTAVSSSVGATTVCAGDVLPDVVFTFTGVGPFDFTYTDGVTPVNITGHSSPTFTIATAPAGTYSVTALSDNNGCAATSLGGTVTVTEEVAPTAEAGNPQSICVNATATLTGSSVGGSAATGAWTIISQPAGGDGAVSDVTQTSTPSAITFTATVVGSYTLRLTTDDPAGTCTPATDDVIIDVTAAATVDAGPAQTICIGGSATLSATFSGTTGITWSTPGDGAFDDVNSANAVYTPGFGDIAAGFVTLTATTAGPCAAETDNVIITINAAPTVDAGAPQTICSSASVVLNASFGGSATGLIWSTSGNGTFDDATDPNASYTPGSADLPTVTLTATATGSCPGVTDNVIITVNPAAIVDAGAPQTVCIGSPVVLDATLTGPATSMTWTTSGNGTFSNSSDPDATYTPDALDLTNGTVTLTATTNNPAGPCPAAVDNVLITFMAIPGDQTTPGNETWIGYAYDDTGDTRPIASRIDFGNAKYRGFIEAVDIDNMTGLSTYDVTTDEFDLNLGLADPIQGPNVCGTLLNSFSVRYKMNKTFAEGVYRFTVGADDGVRLLVDGVNVLDPAAFKLQPYTEYTSGAVCLSAGIHALEIQHFDNTAYAQLTFEYEEVPALTLTPLVQVCVNSPAPVLTASSTDTDVVDYNWYKNGTLVFTGANYTPASAELDMTTAATTSFEVTAVYSCGETEPQTVDVEVLNSATLAMVPQTICESGVLVDLRDFISASPAGGTFTFSGHPNITGNNFDPAGLAGSTVSVLVDYSTGSCTAPQATLDLTITNSATVTAPATPVVVCEAAADVDLTTLVSAVPGGGSFTFAGPQVTGNNFSPSGLSGVQTITVNYANGGCTAGPVTFDIDVVTSASLVVSNANACENGSAVNLLSLVTASPAGGTLTFTGVGVTGSLFNPAGQSGVINVAVSYDVNGCTENATFQVTVLPATDGTCASGNCSTVVIIPRPEPATCTNSDGRMVMDIQPFTPAVNNTGVKITIDGISSTNLPITRTIYNSNTFEALPVGNYNYTIEYGDPSCIKTGFFSIDQSGTVGTPVASNISGPVCFGSATGSLTLDLPGETGNILEWSLDGGLTDPFKLFTAGGQITGIPAGPAPTFEQVISVRRNASDVCYSSVTVVMAETVGAITATFDISPATCNGNDGAITAIVPSGGHGAPFTFSVDGGLTYQSSPDFTGLPGGSYALTVRDAIGCTMDFPANITFPGFINSTITKRDADCTNGGDSGQITVVVSDAGAFQVALSTDQFNAPADSEFVPYTSPSVNFNEVPRGQYYVYIKAGTGVCPTRSAPINIFGVQPVTFELEPNCVNNELSLALVNVTGDADGAPLEIQISKKLSSDPPEIVYVQFPADGEIYLDRDEYDFLKVPGDYRIRVIQFQDEVVCNFTSESADFLVPSQLTAKVDGLSESYPDVPSGQLLVNGFNGGAFPYEVRIELDSASSFSLPSYETSFQEAGLNENQQIEMKYTDIPAGRYSVEIMDQVGCVLNLLARVPLDVDLFIPNVFTPNGDGSNDIFFIRNLPQEPAVNQLTITNRWGKQVFVSENYKNNWDGTDAADGIYFYRLQVSDDKPVTGWVEIIRGPKP